MTEWQRVKELFYVAMRIQSGLWRPARYWASASYRCASKPAQAYSTRTRKPSFIAIWNPPTF